MKLAALRIALLQRATASLRRRAPHAIATAHTGHLGEDAAYFYLRQQGCTVVARRWRSAGLRGDLDLIVWDGTTLAIVEVKTRTRRDAYPAAFAVDDDKRTMLRRMASAYLAHLPANTARLVPRFDVLSVYLDEAGPAIEWLRDAFR